MYGVTLFPVSPVMKRLASVAVAVAAEAVGPTARAPDDAALDDAALPPDEARIASSEERAEAESCVARVGVRWEPSRAKE